MFCHPWTLTCTRGLGAPKREEVSTTGVIAPQGLAQAQVPLLHNSLESHIGFGLLWTPDILWVNMEGAFSPPPNAHPGNLNRPSLPASVPQASTAPPLPNSRAVNPLPASSQQLAQQRLGVPDELRGSHSHPYSPWLCP